MEPPHAVGHVSRDEHFTAYVELYTHLDTTLWQAITFVGLVLSFGFGLLGSVGNGLKLPPLTNQQTLGIALMGMAIPISLGVMSMHRIRTDLRILVGKLILMEGPEWFFDARAKRINKRNPLSSATRVYIIVFGSLAAAEALWGAWMLASG